VFKGLNQKRTGSFKPLLCRVTVRRRCEFLCQIHTR